MTTASPAASARLPAYAELYCVSNFSFLRGASHPEELVHTAAAQGYEALAITDECSLAGVVRAHAEVQRQNEARRQLAAEHGLAPEAAPAFKLLVGSELRVTPEDGQPPYVLVALAQTRQGYGNLAELITLARSRSPKGQYLLRPSDFADPPPAQAHLRGLPGCFVLLCPALDAPLPTLMAQAAWTAATFGTRARMGLVLLNRPGEDLHRSIVDQAARRHGMPVAAAGQVEMHQQARKPLHDTLAAIRLKRPVSECGYALAPNAEQHLRLRARLAADYPPEALAETVRLARACPFSLDEIRYQYPLEIVPEGHTPASYLRQETLAGARRRYPQGVPAKIAAQIEKELELIAGLEYEAYFLTVYDLVKFARSQNILCQGRGSAANSTVCFCLGITEVNPAEIDTLFERFISASRNEPPDIDVDFEHQRREEVIQYVYEKYGRARAALTAVVICYRPRSVLRDTGRALGVDEAIIDAVAKQHQWWDGRKALIHTIARHGLAADSLTATLWAKLAEQLLGFPRHLSQHPGGFVISRGPLNRLVPIENAAMDGRSVVQWDKDDLESLKLMKVDVLALGMLTVLRRALAWIAWRRGRPFGLQDIPGEDPATYDMICKADTIGVFQIESRAQMTMLPRLRPEKFYDLVVQVAIVRPGPIQGGMVHPYLRRRHGLEDPDPPGEEIRKVLARTKGVPIFQEQVMQIAIEAAGFTPDQADQLRRSMAAWKRKGGVEKFRQKLIDGLRGKGYAQDFAESLFRQIEGFGEYGFPESHAASFAKLAYSSAWIKRHEPEAFLAALLDSQPMGFYAPWQLVQDAQRHAQLPVKVWGVDVCQSDAPCTLQAAGPRPAVRLGLQTAGLSEEAARRIVQARRQAPFADTADLARRAGLTGRELDALAAAGALRKLAGHRRRARWEAAGALPERGLLHGASRPEAGTPALPPPTEMQDIAADYRSMRLTLERHPLALLRPRLAAMRFATAAQLRDYPDGRIARACGIVTVRQRPPTAKGTLFLTMEDETGPVNVVIRTALQERQRRETVAAQLLGVYGVWQTHSGVRHLIAGRLLDCSPMLEELAPRSRDFQ
ncbi:error-prone DNA polymerase [Orrella sp. JC864]|uniref:error-prone DNA polymerase n=1 Tax=Orrella sp. JC864 TaxID=3120298 RepID=UPI0030084701